MKIYESLYLILAIFLSVSFFSCGEKDVELKASADMLFQVRTNDFEIELNENTGDNRQEKINAIRKRLEARTHFERGDVFEMFIEDGETIDYYESIDGYKRYQKNDAGKYIFDPNEMKVSFKFGDDLRVYYIDGYFGESFYNHFVHKEGSGTPHTIEPTMIFCLHEDFTNELKQEFPNLVKACIKTDMITARRLKTFKW